MFAGAQVSLYPMADGFVDVILGLLGALDPWRDRLRIETDDISTLIVGPPEVLFPAPRDRVARLSGRAGRSDLPDLCVSQPVRAIGGAAGGRFAGAR